MKFVVIQPISTFKANRSDETSDLPTFESNLIISVIIGVFLIVGATGSLLTMMVIGKNKHLHTTANFFIFSLCLSDTVSALICSPFWTYRRTWGFHSWMWGDFSCKFYWVLDFSTNYVTSLHIVSFSALRFAAVKWPFLVSRISKRATFIYLGVLWIMATASSFPLGYLMGVDSNRTTQDTSVKSAIGSYWPSCSILNTMDCCVSQYNTYLYITNSIMFYIPDILIIICSFLIAFEIRKMIRWRKYHSVRVPIQQERRSTERKKSKRNNLPVLSHNHENKASICNTICAEVDANIHSQTDLNNVARCSSHHISSHHFKAEKNESHAFLQLSLIVIGYMFGYIPVTVYLLWTTTDIAKSQLVDYWFGVVSYLFLRFTECMNPLLYNLGSSNIRRETKRIVQPILGLDKKS